MAGPDYLQPDEAVLLDARRHPLSILDDILAASVLYLLVVGAVLTAVLVFWPEGLAAVGIPFIGFATILMAAFVVARVWRVRTSRYLVTQERAYKSYGRLRWFLGQTTYDKVTDLHVKQSLWGRMYGFGTVRLETAGTGLALEGLEDPFGAKRRIEAARADFIRLLAEGQRATRRTAEAAMGEAEVGERTLWQGAPAAKSAAVTIVAASLMLLVGLALLAFGIAMLPLLAPGAVLFVVGSLAGLGTWVHLRFTRYHVLEGGVVVTSGWLTRRRVETTYEKVTDVSTYQGVLGRVMDFGQITINTAGSNMAPVVFRGIDDPEDVKARIDGARREWRKQR